MGQAVVDLPDPLEKPAAGPTANADELLAQLAGDEIDRMLAEADVERPAAEDAAPAAAAVVDAEVVAAATAAVDAELPVAAAAQVEAPVAAESPVVESLVDAPPEAAPAFGSPVAKRESAKPSPEMSSALDELFNAINDSPIPAPVVRDPPKPAPPPGSEPAAPSRAAVELDDALSAQLNDLFTELNKPDPSVPQPAAKVAAKPVEKVADKKVIEIAPPKAEPAKSVAAQETDDLERQVLSADAMEAVGQAMAAPPPAERIAKVRKSDSIPIYMLPLVWINAPLAKCSDDVRDMIGKIAITTLINAMAVLIYVLLFR